MARRFFYVSLGILALSVAYHLGASGVDAQDLDDHEDRISTLESRVKRLRGEVDFATSRVDDLESMVYDLDSRVSDLE